jgi:hypothetical protein
MRIPRKIAAIGNLSLYLYAKGLQEKTRATLNDTRPTGNKFTKSHPRSYLDLARRVRRGIRQAPLKDS